MRKEGARRGGMSRHAAGPAAGEAVRAEAGGGPRGRGGRHQASQTQPLPLGKGTGKAQAGTGDQGRGGCDAQMRKARMWGRAEGVKARTGSARHSG